MSEAATLESLEALGNLSDDWNSYGAPAPNPRAIALSRDIHKHLYLKDLQADRVLPSAEGGVGFAFFRGPVQADIEVFNTGEILAGIYHVEKASEIWNVQEVGLDETLERISAITNS